MEICKVCGNMNIGKYWDSEKIFQCKNCDLIFLSDKLMIEKLDRYYMENPIYATNYLNSLKYEIMVENSKDRLKFLLKNSLIKGKKLLDIGANFGVFVEEANKLGAKAVGLEINRAFAENVQNREIPVFYGDIESYDFKYKFDVITLFHVLEHLKDPLKIIRKVRDLLVDDGFLVLEVPNIQSYLANKDRLSWKYIALEHIFYYSPETLKKILQKEGFRVLLTKKKNFEIKYLGIRAILRYIWGEKSQRDRFQMKEYSQDSKNLFYKRPNLLKRIIKTILVSLIHLLGREDHIIIIAKKVR